MAKRLLLAFALFSFFGVFAQPYGNEWINYNQQYFKFKVAKTGVYRINFTTLSNSGVPLSSVNPKNIRIYGRGKEIPVYVQGESDGVFNSTDFIEFYAERNDGFLDSVLYSGAVNHPNPYYSLYNDTAVYFLTWSTTTASTKHYTAITDTAKSGYSSAPYVWMENINYYTGEYFNGETNDYGGTEPAYVKSEGWGDVAITLGNSKIYSLNTTNLVSNAPPCTLSYNMVGASRASGYGVNTIDHRIQVTYQNSSAATVTIADTSFGGYQLIKRNTQLLSTNVTSPLLNITVASVAVGSTSSNRTAIPFWYLKYPHNGDMENKTLSEMYVDDDSFGTKTLLSLSNVNSSGNIHLFDITNLKRIEAFVSDSVRFLIPNGGTQKKCVIYSDNLIHDSLTLTPVGSIGYFTDYYANDPDSAFLLVSHKSLSNEIKNYDQYRSSIAGGSYNVITAYIDELYDQYAYGIEKHPLAITHFAKWGYDSLTSKPKALLLVGKSYHPEFYRKGGYYNQCLVPSAGNPCSDVLFTSGWISGSPVEPGIATGRISAQNENHVSWYLNKLKEYENTTPDVWMKNVLHFGGGTGIAEQSSFKAYLNGYKNIIEDTFFGGVVRSFFKTSSAPIQINTSDSLTKLIEGGVSLMTFFGHASGSSFDQSIDKAVNYNNKGKYPMLLANSCYSGDIHSTALSHSEEFVLIQNKGVIAYLASTSQATAGNLHAYSTNFYQNLGYKKYAQPVGDIMKETVKNSQGNGLDIYMRNTCLEMTLHGDPMVIINSQRLPDYTIAAKDVSFDQTSQIDSITMYFTMTNIGKAISDSFRVEITRIFPNNESTTYLMEVTAPLYQETASLKIPVDFVRGIGLNKIKIRLDVYNEIAELNELNNDIQFPYVDLFIEGGDIVPVYPYKYAIIPTDTVTVKACTPNPFAPAANYVFQIDTNDTFLNPLAVTTLNNTGGVLTWKVPFNFTDSTVYYWRVSIDSVSSGYYNWRESSFQYIIGKRGWEQAHFFQFKNDDFEYVKFNRPQRKFDFVNDVKSLLVQTGVDPYTSWKNEFYTVNGTTEHIGSCAPTGFTFVVFDPVTGKPWETVLQSSTAPGYGQYGNLHCDYVNFKAFDFCGTDTVVSSINFLRKSIADFIDSIPNGYRVLCYTQANHRIEADTTLYQSFEKLGSDSIRLLKDKQPYILWGTKGGVSGSAREVIGSNITDLISLTDAFNTNWNEGFVASEIIGPAASWGSLHWRQNPIELPNNDSIRLRVIGIKLDGTQDILIQGLPRDSGDIMNLASFVDVNTYPYLQLVAYMSDNSKFTPPQLDRWQVIYGPMPELAIQPRLGFTLYNDTLQEGDRLKLSLAVENISDFDFIDTLLTTYWVEDKNKQRHDLPDNLRKPSFIKHTWYKDTVSLNTNGYQGLNTLWVEVNPINKKYSQLEQYHFNNIARVNFYVGGDKINPLLDVTFDGVHILNGDIVSAKPNILVTLKDENKYLALNDTSAFAVYLKHPGASTEQRIYFGTEMTFTPAQLPNNSCKINYVPNKLSDGVYELNVQARDRSNNFSGSLNYRISFEVINKASITELVNYPNPFSTSTRFVFTLTGSEIPDDFRIQVMTITGKVVREIGTDELGTIHIGRNITEFAWDGRDQYGDLLANGVYLYRVITRMNGEMVEKRKTDADQYFNKGFGKMYIIR